MEFWLILRRAPYGPWSIVLRCDQFNLSLTQKVFFTCDIVPEPALLCSRETQSLPINIFAICRNITDAYCFFIGLIHGNKINLDSMNFLCNLCVPQPLAVTYNLQLLYSPSPKAGCHFREYIKKSNQIHLDLHFYLVTTL